MGEAGIGGKACARNGWLIRQMADSFLAAKKSAVGFAAVADAEDGDGQAVVAEANAIVAAAEAELGRVNALELLYVAGAGFGEAFDGVLDAAGDAFIESGQVFQSRPCPFDLHYSNYSNPSLRIASA